MKKFLTQVVTVFILLSVAATASAQFGKGVKYMPKDSSFTMNFDFRFQTLFTATIDESKADGEQYSSSFLVRRARLKFGGYAYSPNVEYKAEIGLSNRDISIDKEDGNGRDASRLILDAVLKWKFSKNWTLWAGQTKLPGNRERVISSANLQFVDRSLVNSELNIDRDAGLQVRGKFKAGNTIIKSSFAISQGEGRNITSNNFGGYDYTARVDFLPTGEFKSKGDYDSSDLKREDKPKVAIGVTFDYNDGAVRQGGQLGSFVEDSLGNYVENSLMTFFADAIFKYNGVSVMTEFGTKSADKQISNISKKYNTGTAFSFQAGYLFKSNWEIAGRYAMVRSDDDVFSGISDENQYTLGLSRYVVGHKLKFQTDITRIEFPGIDDGKWQFRMQCEMQF
ncbi:MAG: phosphate-selective porin OprO/OprP [Saprospiraceae bacterium]|jgi:phosphate-selective porin OprO/OprP